MESPGYSSDEWEGVVYCERCGGWTLHLGFQLPEWLRILRVIPLPIGRRRYAMCRGCSHRWEMSEEEEGATRAAAQNLLSHYLALHTLPGPDEKFRADDGAIAGIRADLNQPPLTIEEYERKLQHQDR